ncbi:MAG: hypothetical protein QOJ54_2669 [Aliidongia sp.]|jgi:hypothetical protein|nr:hypothetical protein [Aliidongia sp.]
MRPKLALLAVPFVVAACGSDAPPPTPVVINTTPAPTFTASVPATPSGLANQCQGLFAQALDGRAVNYATPAISSAGDATTVRLSARPVTAAPGTVVQYSCNFSGSALVSSGMN